MGKYDAQTAWKANNTTRIVLNLNHRTDAELLDFLRITQNRQGLIKQLLRDHIASVTNTDDKK